MSDALERLKRWDAVLGVDEAVARAVANERAAVVAWLRAEAIRNEVGAIPWEDCELRMCAFAIERGEHRREEET